MTFLRRLKMWYKKFGYPEYCYAEKQEEGWSASWYFKPRYGALQVSFTNYKTTFNNKAELKAYLRKRMFVKTEPLKIKRPV
jgi:hypothetical protein